MPIPPRLSLARLPTPIHRLDRLSRRVGKEIFLWRDDLTGFLESGNKVRKLEFLLAEAMRSGAQRVITAGGPQSNHTRATAFLARRLGLEITIVVRLPRDGSPIRHTGNFLLNELAGADFEFISYVDYQAAGSIYAPFLQAAASKKSGVGEKVFVISEGGSVPLGCWGYIAAVEEMLQTWRKNDWGETPSALFCAVGSGGTHAGLRIGFHLQGLDPKTLWAVNICDTEDYFQNRVGRLIEETVQQFGLAGLAAPFGLQILDGHQGTGYGLASDEDLRLYRQLVEEEGVLLDPVYTGKAFRGMLREIEKEPGRFGNRILFLHSGGTLATFAYAEQFLAAGAPLSGGGGTPGEQAGGKK